MIKMWKKSIWEQYRERGIDVMNISPDSEAYRLMRSAALDKDPSAQYYMGLWEEKVNKKPYIARTWLRMAERQNYKEATSEIRRIEREYSFSPQTGAGKQMPEAQLEDTTHEHDIINSLSSVMDIKPHDFQNEKNALKKFSEQKINEIQIDKVKSEERFLFFKRVHQVTGAELNNITSEIQSFLIYQNQLSQRIIEEFGHVYRAFESLDKDYITGIVASIKSAEEVSKKEQENRSRIKVLVDQHELSVAVLKKFKEDLDDLKDLTNQEFIEYMTDLSKVTHLKDVDVIYADLEKLKNNLVVLSNLQTEYANTLSYVKKYCDMLSDLQHIGDIDELWSITESATKEIQSIEASLEDHMQAICASHRTIQQIQESQKQFVDMVNNTVFAFRGDVNKQIKTFTEAQEIKLIDISRQYSKDVENLSIEQKAKLESIELDLRNSLDSAVQEQFSAISKIENTQEEKFDELLESQSSTLEQIANDQSSKLGQIYQSLEEEKNILNEHVTTLARKVKFLYVVAGGATALTAIQLLLNILGVF